MNLQENILRIREMMGLNESSILNPTKKLYHLSRYTNRDSILKYGLNPGIGQKTKNWNTDNQTKDKIGHFVYLTTNPSNINKVMYGFDTWLVDTSNINLELQRDPNHPNEDRYFVTKHHIPPHLLKLVDENKESDDYYIDVEKNGFPQNSSNEVETNKDTEVEIEQEPSEWDKLLNMVGDREISISVDDFKKSLQGNNKP